MNQLYHNKMTESEIHIANKIIENKDKFEDISITNFSHICNLSNAMIVKYAKNCGFDGFKELKYYVKEQTKDKNSLSNRSVELKIASFFDSIDEDKAKELINICETSEKIILYGLGPSQGVCNYFVPRFRTAFTCNVICETDIQQLESEFMMNGKKVLIILSASGKDESYLQIINKAKQKKIRTVMISENSNCSAYSSSDLNISLLNNYHELDYEVIRGRTLFFIYLEMLIQAKLNNDYLI